MTGPSDAHGKGRTKEVPRTSPPLRKPRSRDGPCARKG